MITFSEEYDDVIYVDRNDQLIGVIHNRHGWYEVILDDDRYHFAYTLEDAKYWCNNLEN